MPTLELDDDELAAVSAALKEAINRDRYHLAPRLEPFRRALANLDPESVLKPVPPLDAAAESRSHTRRR
jgi:hypothetical protein